jgi:hypothetical protein
MAAAEVEALMGRTGLVLPALLGLFGLLLVFAEPHHSHPQT